MTDKNCKYCKGKGFTRLSNDPKDYVGYLAKLPCPECNAEAYRSVVDQINDLIMKELRDSPLGRSFFFPPDLPRFNFKLPPDDLKSPSFFMGPLDAEPPKNTTDEFGDEWTEIKFSTWVIMPKFDDDGDRINIGSEDGISLTFKDGKAFKTPEDDEPTEDIDLRPLADFSRRLETEIVGGAFRGGKNREMNRALDESICPHCELRTLGPVYYSSDGRVAMTQCVNCGALVSWPTRDDDRRLVD